MKPGGAIGVFDSGVGGLTVVKALRQRIPQESILYFADEAHVPYGERSPDEIQSFALGITHFLIQRGAKLVIMGCNMSSALALEPARQLFPGTPIIGVIAAGARAAVRASNDGRIGVLATTGTVRTHAYANTILRLRPDAYTYEQACPRFVPLVESGMCDSEEAESAVREYLEPVLEQRCTTIILGCTHYPFLRNTILRVVGPGVTLIDPAEETAIEAANILDGLDAGAPVGSPADQKYFVTGALERFVALGGQFLGEDIKNVQLVEWGREVGAIEWPEKVVEETTKSAP